MCNGKKIACVPSMLHNKILYNTEVYDDMIYAALQVDFMNSKTMSKNHPYLFCTWYPTGNLACATRWTVLEGWLLDRQGTGEKFRGTYTFDFLWSFANLCLESPDPSCSESSVNYTQNEYHSVLKCISVLISFRINQVQKLLLISSYTESFFIPVSSFFSEYLNL